MVRDGETTAKLHAGEEPKPLDDLLLQRVGAGVSSC